MAGLVPRQPGHVRQDLRRGQRAVQVQSAARSPLELPARCQGDLPRPDEHDLVHGELMFLRYPRTDRRHDIGSRPGPDPHTRGLLHDDEGLLSAEVNGERGVPHGGQTRKAAGGGHLDVLRVDISTAEDHQVAGTPGDEQFTVQQYAQIPGTQVRPLAGGQDGAKGLRTRLRCLPVSGGDAVPAHPDLADLRLRHPAPAVRIHNGDVETGHRPAGTHQCARRAEVGRRTHRAPLQFLLRDVPDRRTARSGRRGHDQRALREPVGRHEAGPAEATPSEGFGEPVQDLRPHRFRAGQRHRPAREVQAVLDFRTNLLGAHPVREVRRAAGGGPVVADGLQPPLRASDERDRGHQGRRETDDHWADDAADQTHVVMRGEPAHDDGLTVQAEGAGLRMRVRHQVCVGNHHPLGSGRRTRGELEERHGFRPARRHRRLLLPAIGHPAVGDHPTCPLE